MCLIFCEDGLKEIKPPCVAQSFINHNARLYKVFVIKDRYTVIERPSLKNFRSGSKFCSTSPRPRPRESTHAHTPYPTSVSFSSDFPTVFFDSHDISKPYSSSFLTELDDDDNASPAAKPNAEHLDRIVQVVRDKLDVVLFGIDVIIEKRTGRYAIIDINLFPGVCT